MVDEGLPAQGINTFAQHGGETRIAMQDGPIAIQRHTAFVHGAEKRDVGLFRSVQIHNASPPDQRIAGTRADCFQLRFGFK